jgi:hypothetical protein
MDCKQPHLGLATTRELLDELRARFEIHATGGLDYRTVDGEALSKKPIEVNSNGPISVI